MVFSLIVKEKKEKREKEGNASLVNTPVPYTGSL